jgi:hypothetical protein
MEMNEMKVYVEVVASFDFNGRLMPLSLTWEDGRQYTIERVIAVHPAPALKAGGQGDRYTIQVQGRDKYLFFERSASLKGNKLGRWFVERKINQ